MKFPRASIVSLYDEDGDLLWEFLQGQQPNLKNYIDDGLLDSRTGFFFVSVNLSREGGLWDKDDLDILYHTVLARLSKFECLSLSTRTQHGLPKACAAWFEIFIERL